MKIDDLITALLQREGGHTKNPADRGGETMWGITQATARRNGYSGPMASMPRSVAAAIYRNEYWVDPGFGDVYALVPGMTETIAEELLDTGVNMGPGTAVKFLQRSLNVLNRKGTMWPDLKIDGEIGRKTLDALSQLLRYRGQEGVIVLLRMLNAQQSVRYIELAEAREDQEEFQFGWQLNRVEVL